MAIGGKVTLSRNKHDMISKKVRVKLVGFMHIISSRLKLK